MKFKKRKRGNSRFFLLFFLLASLLVTILWTVSKGVRKLNLFTLDEIVFENQNNLSEEFLMDHIKDYLGLNLYSFSKKQIKDRFSNIVRLKSLKVSKIIPGTLKVKVEERQTFLILKTQDGDLVPLDSEFVVLDSQIYYRFEDVPIAEVSLNSKDFIIGNIIDNPVVERLMSFHGDILEMRPDLMKRVSEYYIKNDDIYIIDTKDHCEFVFGEENLEEKLIYYGFLSNQTNFEKNITYDFRYDGQAVARRGTNEK